MNNGLRKRVYGRSESMEFVFKAGAVFYPDILQTVYKSLQEIGRFPSKMPIVKNPAAEKRALAHPRARSGLDENENVLDILDQLAPLLDGETMSALNWEVAGNGREADEVAREFLVDNGLISE